MTMTMMMMMSLGGAANISESLDDTSQPPVALEVFDRGSLSTETGHVHTAVGRHHAVHDTHWQTHHGLS